MEKVTLIATTKFGLEAVVNNEVLALGFPQPLVSAGKVEFETAVTGIPQANLWLRCADRVLLKMGEFRAETFDELFEQGKSLAWENWITVDGRFPVIGKSVKSTLHSVRSCQSIVKKAVVERLKAHYQVEWFAETGPEFTIQVAMLNDVATLTIDTSGVGLHKRGYRQEAGEAPLKETFAAGLVLLSDWQPGDLLIDPLCGSGTILIEAALIARHIAPGLNREFAAEYWPAIAPDLWREARESARAAIKLDGNPPLSGTDRDATSIETAHYNAGLAGVREAILFEQKNIRDLWIDQQYGTMIANPPYGLRLSDPQEMKQLYGVINKIFKKKSGWSVNILTADEQFPTFFSRAQPDRVRKFYNGTIKVNYYQYRGEKSG
jgi:putative N6-adenine-specific DNA methylase